MRLFRTQPPSTIDGLLSDALRERYGPISARVLRHDAREREAHLVDRRGVTRIFSVTFLSRPLPPSIRAVNARIRDGGLIGDSFRDAGFAIKKNLLDVTLLPIPAWLRSDFGVKERHAWSRIFEFHVRKGTSAPRHYATLCEIFTPDFKPPIVTPEDVARVGASLRELVLRGLSEDAAWNRVGRYDGPRDIQGRFAEARIATLRTVFRIRDRVAEILASP